MRVAHLSDTHLGFAEFDHEDPGTGFNLRELDAYRAFQSACARIRSLKPDLVLHTGDLFDHPRPPNAAIASALREFAAFDRAGVPVVLIAGNHELTVRRGSACILDALQVFDGLHVAASESRVFTFGNARVVAVPHLRREQDLIHAVEAASPDASFTCNILAVHAGLRGGPPREWTEALLPRALVRDQANRFDYVALGHYHRPLRVAPQAWYAGATERFHGETRGRKGFLLADLGVRRVERHQIPTRDFAERKLDCAGLSPAQILVRTGEATADIPDGAVLTLVLNGIEPRARADVNLDALRARLGRMLHVDIRLRGRRGSRRSAAGFSSRDLPGQFESFVASRARDPVEQERLRRRWREAVAAAEQAERRASALTAATAEARAKAAEADRRRAQEEHADLLRALAEHLEAFRDDLRARFRPVLSREASALVEAATGGRFTRVLLDPGLVPRMEDGGREYVLWRFSGGEQDLACVALRLGLLRVATAAAPVEFAVLDEIFGSQDRLRRRALVEALRRLIPPFRQLFVVTHAEDVQDLFPSILPMPPC